MARAGCGGSAPAEARAALDGQPHAGRSACLPQAVRRLWAAAAAAGLPALVVEQLSHAGASLAAQRGADGGRNSERRRFTGVLRPLSSLGTTTSGRCWRQLDTRRADVHGRGRRRVRFTGAHACHPFLASWPVGHRSTTGSRLRALANPQLWRAPPPSTVRKTARRVDGVAREGCTAGWCIKQKTKISCVFPQHDDTRYCTCLWHRDLDVIIGVSPQREGAQAFPVLPTTVA